MRADRFPGQVVAVLSRRTPAFAARPGSVAVIASLIRRLAALRFPPGRRSSAPPAEFRPADMPPTPVVLGEYAFREIHPAQERRLPRAYAFGVDAWAFLVAVLVLWQVFQANNRGVQHSLVIFLGFTLPLVFLCYRPTRRKTLAGKPPYESPRVLDLVLAVLAVLAAFYPLLPWKIGGGGDGYDAFLDRQGILSALDVAAGVVLLLLAMDAARRATGTGLVLPAVCLACLAYSYYGGYLPQDWSVAHAGLGVSQIVNGLYNEASGFYGAPLAAAATYIMLFNIYGAVLDASGAGKFFVGLGFSVFRRSRTAPARTAALSGFLLGTVSGSGTAATATTSAVTWPMLRSAGYTSESAGGLLAASGIGAMLSPPTLGAVAFIIVEYLGVSYFDVLVWSLVPMLLYYLGIMLAVEADARRFRAASAGDAAVAAAGEAAAQATDTHARQPWRLLRHGGYLVSIVIMLIFLGLDYLPYYAVVWAMATAALFALVVKLGEQRRTPVRAVGTWAVSMVKALAAGVRNTLPVVAVCVAAGVVTSTFAKSGLGQVLPSSLAGAARALGHGETAELVLTALFCAVATFLLGLGLPVVASFIVAWVALGPALTDVGVTDPEAAMFLFYYAVLSEVTPPTAIAPLAASAITGGSVFGTIVQTWKYTLPAFLVPFAFVLTDNGSALLGQGPLVGMVWVAVVSAVGVFALAAATCGWMLGPARLPERAMCVPAALLLLYLDPLVVAVGAGILAAAVAVHVVPRSRLAVPEVPGPGDHKKKGTNSWLRWIPWVAAVRGKKGRSSRRRWVPWVAAAAAAVLVAGPVAVGCGGKRDAPVAGVPGSDGASCQATAGRITIATGNIGGVFYALGGGLAQVINDNTGLRATAAETGASGQNIQQLVAGDYDIAFSAAPEAFDAVYGRGRFDGDPQRIEALTRLYPEYVHVLVRTGIGIDSIEDLRGRRVSTGSPKSGTETTAHHLLWAAGLDPGRDIQAQRLDLAKTAAGLDAGTIDALIWTGGLPAVKMTEITSVMRGQVKFLEVGDLVDEMNEVALPRDVADRIERVYEPGDIVARTYGQPDDVHSIKFPSLLLVRENFPAGAACAVTTFIFDKKAELEDAHEAAKDITLNEARNTEPVPLHPGARRALDDLGAPG